ncbi:response regulator transcription factor [Stappia indica]|uniref:HTH luxR-type domain-containing protein n=1 Tax=Stappia indica TaxID=538381 RepID=A0A857C3N4_9HYPH|nr:helix-turn-helix domain-containing protein [Stappia indica]QGZ33620.1 hypothetical protein GH266_03340 [Stappia indica]
MTSTLEAVPFEAVAEARKAPLSRELYRAWHRSPAPAPAPEPAPQNQIVPAPPARRRPRRPLPALTNRERDCVAWAAEGKTEWESAAILGIAPKTVESHLIAARRKLNAANKVHLVAKAFRLGLID